MNRLRNLSIRSRITIQTLAIALVLCAVAAVVFRFSVASVVRSSTAQLVINDAAPYEADIRADPVAPVIKVGEDDSIAVLDPSGNLILSTLPRLLRPKLPELAKIGGSPVSVSGGATAYLARAERVKTDEGTWRIVTVRSERPGLLVLSRLTLTLIVGALILVLAFGVVAWLLTGAALRPVRNMRQKAEQLGSSNARDELPVGRAHDELAELATTLNAFLDRNRETIEREKRMLSDTSHELRTPLAILSAQLELAAAPGRDAESMRSQLEAARETSVRLGSLTSNLLELAKLEAGTPAASADSDSLGLEVAAAIDRARMLAQPLGIVVDFEVESSASDSARFPISAAGLGSILDNLLANAIHASTPHHRVWAVIGVDDTALRVEVNDEGHGMREGFIPIAFQRFSRPDYARERSVGGSGLGLAIVHGLVVAAGGQANIENRNPGLRVSVVIPTGVGG
ncbi:ATP-binding protein [soil metagenome]